jgi:signal transduction histidine kinase
LSAVAARLPAALAGITRSHEGRLLGGVCAGLGRSLRVDPTVVRLVFALLALADGAGVLAYGGAWLVLPEDDGARPRRGRHLTGLVMVAAALVFGLRGLGIGDSIVWPAALVGGAVYVSLERTAGAGRARAWRVALAFVLGSVGILLFLHLADNGGSSGTAVAPTGLAVALLLVVGPWAWRLARERDAERLERIRAQERADMAARVHDSVLQTLALVQRTADDPKRVAALARRQERELRGVLYGDLAAAEGRETLRASLEDMLADVEELHDVRVELVQTGDAPLDRRLEALVLATREAVTNAAVHAGVDEIAVFVEAGAGEIAVYVRDRGIGFARQSVAADRRGIAESIEARMERHGGAAHVRAAPGKGTEVELRLPREAAP